ncbi:MAG TPA: 4-vinyl reductase [Chloroflexia bacterium]|nr:4-vinyl reductase [Chloroflexia bacterium]
MVEGSMRSPQLAELGGLLAELPEEKRLGVFVQHFGPVVARTWSPVQITEDAEAWYITVETCATCLGLREVSAPICASAQVLYQGLATKILGRRVRVSEVECAAQGAAACRFALYK